MVISRRIYRWFYDHIHSHYYNLLLKWCFLPFGGEERCREALVASVSFSEGERILELCCGTGGATCAITGRAEKACAIVGWELSIGQLSNARRRPGLERVHWIQGDASRIALRDRVFDKVFITHALHEMPRDIRYRVLAEARRVVKERGKVIVLEIDNPPSPLLRLFVGFWFFYWLPFNFETPTRRDMFRHGLTREIQETGLRNVVKTSKYGGVFQVIECES
jgi:demethylmenaquinone methyltransferase/2-methoxy-6-polyprenyl-1,4-benzoquinol methylase